MADSEAEKEVTIETEKKKPAHKVPSKAYTELSEVSRMSRRRKRVKKKKCAEPQKLECQEDKAWRLYMRMFTSDIRKRLAEEKKAVGAFYYKREVDYVPCATDTSLPTSPFRYDLNAFNVSSQRTCGEKTIVPKRIYDRLRETCLTISDEVGFIFENDPQWPERLWPCSKRDQVRERKIQERKRRMREMGAIPCDIDEIDSPGTSEDERMQELANLKELTHARIPITQSKKDDILLVDRSCGNRPSLVEGDYMKAELWSKRGKRVYANIILRGLVGMHLAELQRVREKTWKFCMYQALVALLAKTQLRYKFMWSANIDYIYELAWSLFLHMGCLNVKANQRFDDVLVYNYKYSVELELIQELNDIPVVTDVPFNFLENTLRKQYMRGRKEITLIKDDNFGGESDKDKFRLTVHKGTKIIEKWFEQLESRYTNCIFRTTKFALAFWQDGSFWYMYNPYRCDKYGLWRNRGHACVTKFCTRSSLKRHLMILTLRAYVHNSNQRKKYLLDNCVEEKFTIQIYQLLFHSCQIHNVKLLTRSPRQPKTELVQKESEPCTFDPHAHLTEKPCGDDSSEDEAQDELNGKMERSRWVRVLKITWSKCIVVDNNDDKELKEKPTKWHAYHVVEPRRLYVLWGEMHITNKIFAEENRNKQDTACYVVFAGIALVNTPEYWTHESLNAIVVCGDKFYAERRKRLAKLSLPQAPDNDPDNWNHVPNDKFRIGEFLFHVQVHPLIHGRLFLRTSQCLWQSLEQLLKTHTAAILCCENVRLGILKHCGAYYMCDVKTYGPPIFYRGHGCAYLLRIACFDDLVKCLVLTIGSPECSKFTLRALEIGKIVDVGEDECERKRKVCDEEDTCKSNCDTGRRGACPFEEERKKAQKKGRKSTTETDEKDHYRTICVKRGEQN